MSQAFVREEDHQWADNRINLFTQTITLSAGVENIRTTFTNRV